jgi:hypothetical protein
LAKDSGAKGGKTWQETIIKLGAFGAGFLIPAWAIIAYSLF